MKRYNPSEIETKWQEKWQKTEAFRADDFSRKPKYYAAGQFPYPSGIGLHAGHAKVYTITDAMARFYRQQGYNVLNPIGWDTFGMPAENYAIKTGISPQDATRENIANFKKQFKRMGISIDWSREINTSHPEYYRWTQWIFKKLYERGLAYQAESYQWWCPVDKTVLANEQVECGHCWRCGSNVEKRKMKQWFFKITDYAEELLKDIDSLDWPEGVKQAQKNWIGRSEGAEIEFAVDVETTDTDTKIKVFTTRPDTIFGVTFMALAPEHPLALQISDPNTKATVEEYIKKSLTKTDIERQENKEKTGVFTGNYVINPVNDQKIPIWVADYVLGNYGEGALMGVPAHDERDLEFAEKFKLPVIDVIDDDGKLINSSDYDGQTIVEATPKIIAKLTDMGVGNKKVQYKMRDWLISRQRYWGAPIPVAYDAAGQVHLIPDDQLPVVLPKIDDYQPDGSGKSVLARDQDFLKVTIDGQEMERETDTMDGFACSSWYLLRYADPRNTEAAWDPAKVNYWNPVDFYVGGEHSTTHMLYVRFWTMVFRDMGLTNFSEPITKFLKNGQILAEDGRKMSKSLGNTLDPLEVIDQGYGADALRTYILFMVPPEGDANWSTKGLGGVYRFLNRVWNLVQEYAADNNTKLADNSKSVRNPDLAKISAKMVKKVTDDMKKSQFNTAVAALMEAVNEFYLAKRVDDANHHTEAWRAALGALVRCLAPFAPHLACECYEILGFAETIEEAGWPTYDAKDLTTDEVELIIQVNGRLRGRAQIGTDLLNDNKKLEEAALNIENVKNFIGGQQIKKVIVIAKNKLVNIVV